MATYTKCTKGNPGTIFEAFTLASMELRDNETVRRISGNFNAQNLIAEKFREMGMTRFINLTHNSQQSLIALAMYVGDGIVAKIIPSNYLGQYGAIYHVPSISSHEIKVESRNGFREQEYDAFTIKTYPWVPPGVVEKNDIDSFRSLIRAVGMEMNAGDDQPKNIHRLPIRSQRMVGIDSAMYSHSKNLITEQMENGWHEFMHMLYPVYDQGDIAPQTEKTNFNFVSLHDRSMEELEYDDGTGKVIRPPTPEQIKESQNIWDNLMKRLRSLKTAASDDKPTVDM